MPPAHQHADQTEPGPDLPNAAALVAEVPAGHASEAVLGRLHQHPLKVQSTGLLKLRLLGDRDPCPEQPVGKLVPDLLELTEIKQARLPAAAGGELEATHRKGGDESAGKLPLEPLDLGS